MSEPYLVDLDQDREFKAVRRLFGLGPWALELVASAVGLDPFQSWFILELRIDRLLPERAGDIDVIGGPLAMGPSGTVLWPPAMTDLVGLEAKAAYLRRDSLEVSSDRLGSLKTGPGKTEKVRRQIQGLLDLGLDRVALLDIIATPPAQSDKDGAAFLWALDVAQRSLEVARPLVLDRLPRESEAGHVLVGMGSVEGGDEAQRGALPSWQLRPARPNSYLISGDAARSRRAPLESRLTSLLATVPRPALAPLVLLDCRPCGRLHWPPEAC